MTTAITDAITQALSVLFEPAAVNEVRILTDRHTASGYFNDPKKVAEAASRWDGRANIYVTLQQINPALLARAANRLVEKPKATTSDGDVQRYCWLPVDLDPVRPAGVSATDTEHEAALEQARLIADTLKAEGWPQPINADSGNGAHLLYRVSLPNDTASRELLKRCLEALAFRFDDSALRVDLKTFNPSRIWKLYGTLACKGDNTAERPWRRAKLLSVPVDLEMVSREQLEALAAMAPRPGPTA